MRVLILAGGSGARLFPLSTEENPKQFLRFNSNYSLFQETVKRSAALTSLENIIVITADIYRDKVLKELKELNIDSKVKVICEPLKKNTAPAITLGIKYLLEEEKVNNNEIIYIFPADHIIHPQDKFIEYMRIAKTLAQEDFIVTFGVKPYKPETGYGYIEIGDKINDFAYKVKRFHEKPDYKTAKRYLASGRFFWNSGIFVFNIETFINEIKKFSKEIYNLFINNDFENFIKNFYLMPDISIDYAIMEKTNKAAVIPMNITWSDIGSWEAVYDILPKDERKNVKIGNVIDLDTKQSLIINNSTDKKKIIITVGVEDIIVIEDDEFTFILKRGEGQKVKEIVKILKNYKR